MAYGSAVRFARSSERATCRCSLLPSRKTIRGSCAVSRSASTTISSDRSTRMRCSRACGRKSDAGDEVLREFSQRLKKSIRGIDLACRYGGEEFVVVMPETDMAVATMVAERLRRRIATEPFPIQQGGRLIEVTISVGLAALGRDDTAATVLKRADQALYRAKRDG